MRFGLTQNRELKIMITIENGVMRIKAQDLQIFPNRLSKSLSSFARSPNKFGAMQTP